MDILAQLMEGNERFRSGRGLHEVYSSERLETIAHGGEYIAAVLSCVDGRVSPDILFDQSLGRLLTCRVPGNTPTDSGVWTFEMAVDAGLSLGIVMGHTECMAIRQVMAGAVSNADIEAAAKMGPEVISQNALRTAAEILRRSDRVSAAVTAGAFSLRAAVYDVHSGVVTILDN